MTVKIGLIGLGMIGRDHLKRLQTVISGAQVTAVCDINHAAVDALAKETGAAAFYDAQEMIHSPLVDAVFICSTGPAHKHQILAAFAAGKPVFCEKPLTPTADESQEIIEAEINVGKRLLQLGFMRRFDPGYQALKQTIESGALGDILLIHCAHRNPSVPESYTLEMAINDSATHEIDIIRYLLGENITSVRVDRPRKKTRHALAHLQDPLVVIFETASGVRIDDELFVNCQYGYDIRCEAIGENGIAALTEQQFISTRSLNGNAQHIPQSCMERFATAYDREVQHFIDSVREGRGISGPSSWDGYVVARVCDAGLASLKDGGKHDVVIPAQPALYR
ncbi:Gfo/Idh/MocA family oxidoreductase [Cronobacter turicensis]|uniref:Gfo/Idh/MocA family oxidoreductase n=1 Tax=Cronobacter turicensis TaxID=413502 RepID=UPI001D403B32|nr:Gfo/Idh/MocA family oxidoreductase [Cronobacter turicensis]EGT4494584.1 gfo/Idh/MocA family oxidoreductase [Cronobacter turicensis]EKM0435951.1 Gfo/Idh/MocA family oxidoreductase [Cronobacter turicensis]ELY2739946.1 Gfo/Idh/MocA family oxidoreductase [Cronobacter turicensis]ELY3545540.1 Gfo/Idh/MocA family oxidoreductase [Cronobacter turicensis]ELY3627013.1 Gfo/Idh/MocA family oxidoreductase [Cronobacter turicensis]